MWSQYRIIRGDRGDAVGRPLRGAARAKRAELTVREYSFITQFVICSGTEKTSSGFGTYAVNVVFFCSAKDWILGWNPSKSKKAWFRMFFLST